MFHENWFDDEACAALTDLAVSVKGLPGRIVEVGCWEGRSTIVLANAVWPATVHAVDTWNGSPGEISETLAAERDVYATFTANIAACTKGNVTVHRQDWRDYFAADDTDVRFCFIDATHSYEEVFDNIRAVLPMLVPGAILCGDDNHCLPVVGAARTLLKPVWNNATLWVWEKP